MIYLIQFIEHAFNQPVLVDNNNEIKLVKLLIKFIKSFKQESELNRPKLFRTALNFLVYILCLDNLALPHILIYFKLKIDPVLLRRYCMQLEL